LERSLTLPRMYAACRQKNSIDGWNTATHRPGARRLRTCVLPPDMRNHSTCATGVLETNRGVVEEISLPRSTRWNSGGSQPECPNPEKTWHSLPPGPTTTTGIGPEDFLRRSSAKDPVNYIRFSDSHCITTLGI